MAKKAGKRVTREVRIPITVTPKLSGLNATVALFKALNREVDKLHTGLGKVSQVKLTRGEVANIIRGHTTKGGSMNPAGLGALFGLKKQDMDRLAASVRGGFMRGGEFRSERKAVDFFTRVLKERNEIGKAVGNAIRGGGTVSAETLGKRAGEELLGLFEKYAQSVERAISGRNAQGQFTAGGEGGGGGGGRKAAKKKGGPLAGAPGLGVFKDEIGRTVTRTQDHTRTVIRQARSLDRVMTSTFDEARNLIKESVTTKGGFSPLQDFGHREKMVRETFRRGKAALAKGDMFGLAALQEQMADELGKVLSADLKEAIGPKRSKQIEELMEARARTLRGTATANRTKAQKAMAQFMVSPETFYRDAKAADDARLFEAEKQRAHLQNLHSRQGKVLEKAMAAGTPPVVAPPKLGGGGGGGGGKPGVLGQWLRNTAKVSMWTSSVGALYGGMAVAGDAMNTVLETGLQTQRLDQVFRGVGGSAKELTRDVLKLAAAEGRSRDEAMESAISWSRLGLTRSQVNEAVRQSLVAANVAELDAAEATAKLQAIMAAYSLQVGDLHGVLGQLNETSNTFNVTNKDLLEGLTRTASVAKQAGIPLQELIGILGAGVGTTGQTGANMGNAIKSIVVALNNPDVQKFLRTQHGLEVTQDGGRGIKPMNQILGELFVKYQGMGTGQQSALLQQVAGKTQASRLAAIMDSYVKGQVLAVNAQLDLNSAEEENARIKESLISKLRMLRTEWDRLVVASDGTSGISSALGGMSDQAGSALRVLNWMVESPLMMGVLAPGTRMGTMLSPVMAADAIRQKFFSTDREKMQRELASMNEQGQQAEGAQRANQTLFNLLGTAGKAFRVMNPAGRAGMASQLGGLSGVSSGFGGALSAAVAGGNMSEVERVLEKEKEAAKARMEAAREEKNAAIEKQKEFLRGAIGSAKGGAKADLEKQLSQVENLGDALKMQDFVDENALGQYVEMTLKGLQALEQTRLVLGEISNLYRGIPAATGMQRNAFEMMGLMEQEKFLKGRIGGIGGMDLSPAEQVKLHSELTSQLQAVQSQLSARGSGMTASQLMRGDRAMIAREMAVNAANRFSRGETPMDQLSNRISGVQRLLAAKERLVQLSQNELERENAMVEAAQLRSDLVQSQIELERERARLVQQEYETSRKLLTAGPQELLTKLMARQMTQKNGGVSAGQFFSFGPDMRAALLEAERSRRNQEWLKRTPSTEALQRRLGMVQPGTETSRWFGGDQKVSETMNAAAVDVANFQEKVNGAAAALGRFEGKLNAIMENIEGRSDVARRYGVQGGWPTTETGAPFLGQAHG